MIPEVSVNYVIDLMVEAVRAANTLAGANVYSFRDRPTRLDALPVVFMNNPDEDLVSLGTNTPQFNGTWSVPIIARLELAADIADPFGLQLQEAVALFREQIRTAILNYTPIMRVVQQISRVVSKAKYTIDGERRQGELQMLVVLETYLGPEDMHDVDAAALDLVDLTAKLKTTAGPGTFDQPFTFDLTP